MKPETAVLLLMAALMAVSCSNEGIVEYKEDIIDVCGNDVCDYHEDCDNCPSDCGNCTENRVHEIRETVVWIKYEIGAKNKDGSYYETSVTGSGVITDNQNDELRVYTNRHLVDCEYGDLNCYQRVYEKTYLRTHDGKIHVVDRVSFAKSIDIAVLTVKTPSAENYSFAYPSNEYEAGEKVIAVGYPSYAHNVVEFSASEGEITGIKDVVSQNTGYGFKSIESNAYASFGSSGGGLFNSEGHLIGINTWSREGETVAVDFKSSAGDDFFYCQKEDAYWSAGDCHDYCKRDEVMTEDRGCASPCDDYYCNSDYSRRLRPDDRNCDRGYVLGSDGQCHRPCGSLSAYCEINNVCLNDRCVLCSEGYLYDDGSCRLYE